MKKILKQEKGPTIRLKTKLFEIGTWTILRLDKSASQKLSSRGLIMAEATLNDFRFQTTLEPDGKGSHWFRVDKTMQAAAKVKAGDTVNLVIEQSREWSEPTVPSDLKNALSTSPKAKVVWEDITAFARWEWIRWVTSTKNEETRQRRVNVALSKLNAGNRRPCCFNTSQCTVPYVSNKGVLMEPVEGDLS